MKSIEFKIRRNAAYENLNRESWIGTYAAGASEISVKMLGQIEMMENDGHDPAQILQTLKYILEFESDFYINIMEANQNG